MAKGSSAAADKSTSLDDFDRQQGQVAQVAQSSDEAALDEAASNNHANLSGRKVRFVINEGEGEIGKAAVDIGFGGYPYQIPRNVECVLPEEVFIACIGNAKVEVFEQTKDGVKSRHINRFSYSKLETIQP